MAIPVRSEVLIHIVGYEATYDNDRHKGNIITGTDLLADIMRFSKSKAYIPRPGDNKK